MLPTKPGVYIFKDQKDKIIYIGKAKNLKKRVSSYFSNKAFDAKTLKLVGQIVSLGHILVNSEIEALLLEAELIKKHKPFFNIRFSDDKSYPYIAITKGKNPAVLVARNRKNKEAFYFGPYVEGLAVRAVLKILRRMFPYQSVRNHGKRKCLYNHLGLCPCIMAIPENKPAYLVNISRIKKFLRGKPTLVLSDLKKEQQVAVSNEEFENAREIQKRIEQIEHVTSEQYDPFKYLNQPNHYQERIKDELKSLGMILADYFNEIDLHRIECYDISNLQGKDATGSMVVFVDGDKSSKDYRRFRVRGKDTPDDFLMMKEVIGRRFRKDGWEDPGLIVIDGGKGQVSAALTVLVTRKKTIPIIGLAKRRETIVIPQKQLGRKLEFLEVKLPISTGGINLLRRIRDEAHRFAITYHRLLRKKRAFAM